jgi:cyclic pyranopterin phosphate synthase
MPKSLSHYNRDGLARMVNVAEKGQTSRTAEASAFVAMKAEVMRALSANPKGDALEVARLAGVMAAKRTADLIPMCHSLALTHVDVNLQILKTGVSIVSRVTATAQTGVEMEALTAVSVAALTVYDMCKALDKGIEIQRIALESKTGGTSGDYLRQPSKKRKKR